MDPTGKISFLPPACVVRLMGQSMKRPRASLGFLRGSDQWLSRNKHDDFIRKLPPLKYASTKKKGEKRSEQSCYDREDLGILNEYVRKSYDP